MSSLLKNMLLALALAALSWFGYRFFFASDEAALEAEDVGMFPDAARETQGLLRTLQQLKDIRLDGSLFSDERFRSFVDYRQPLTDEPAGRENPFAPVRE